MSETPSSDVLLACPFCGAGETLIHPNHYWTGMSSQVISVEVRHWCAQLTSGVSGSQVIMRAKTQAEAVGIWNRRIAL